MKKCQDLRLLTARICEVFQVWGQKVSELYVVDAQLQETTVTDKRSIANHHGLLSACCFTDDYLHQ